MTNARVHAIRYLAGSLLLIAASFVFAITGNVQVAVTDASGQPVPGATVRLVPSSPGATAVTATTDSDGNATLTAEQGSAELIVEHGEDRKSKTVRIPAGGTLMTDIAFGVGGAAPVMKGQPQVGGGVMVIEFDDMPIGKAFDRFQVNGIVTNETEGDLDDLNQRFDHRVKVDGFAVQASWRFGPEEYQPYRWYPYLSGELGRVDLDVEFHNNQSPEDSNTFADRGPLYGIGGGTNFTLTNHWYIGFGASYHTARNIDAERDPPVSVGSGTLVRDRADLTLSSTVAEFIGGHFCNNGGNVWFGVQYYKTEVELDGKIMVRFPPDLVEIEFENDLEEDGVRVVGGLDKRFTPHFLGGISAATDGDHEEIRGYLAYGF
jgi:hypothetical protein